MKRIILISLMLASAVAAYAAGYASSNECVLTTSSALNYRGRGNLTYTQYGGCSSPWDEYAICYFGYEAVNNFELTMDNNGCCFCTNYGPYIYLYGSETEDFTSSVTLLSEYLGANNDSHSYSVYHIPANLRYFKVRFKRDGSAACGKSEFKYFYAERTDSFSFYDGSTKLNDNATVQLSTGVEKEFKINLYRIHHVPSTDKDVTIEVASTDTTNTTDYIKIDNTLFNDYETDSYRSGYYNLKVSEASMKVNFLKNGTYSIYVNVRYNGMILQRRYLHFEVSDNNNK